MKDPTVYATWCNPFLDERNVQNKNKQAQHTNKTKTNKHNTQTKQKQTSTTHKQNKKGQQYKKKGKKKQKNKSLDNTNFPSECGSCCSIFSLCRLLFVCFFGPCSFSHYVVWPSSTCGFCGFHAFKNVVICSTAFLLFRLILWKKYRK
jgi:hypothetical protein